MSACMKNIVGVIGNPIGHSLSPEMQNAAFAKLGICDDFEYQAFEVPLSGLAEAVSGFRALGMRGFNVTIPFKSEVMKYIDEYDELAGRVGAVNTVVNDGGVLKGYNTDCFGAVSALEKAVPLSGKNVFVIGAGGAARAVCYGVLERGAHVFLFNRSVEHARQLSFELNSYFKGKSDFGSMDDLYLSRGKCDVVVNTTPVGMFPDVGSSIVDEEFFLKKMVAMDIVYNPAETRFLSFAKAAGCKTVPGLEMFVGQGAKAFELFTGKKATAGVVSAMRKAVEKALG